MRPRAFTLFVLVALLQADPALLAGQAPISIPEVSSLTLEEKASLVTGQNSWETQSVPRLSIPSVWMADGPVGLRKSLGQALSDSVPATCFPSASAMAATWNPDLIGQVGAGIGAEARFNNVILLLAPGLNLKRHPLGGRNFEYYSEDPLLSGKIAAAFVRGVQSQGVGATLKHFAVNNQEYRRMTIDAQVDERTLREMYLRGFEIAVKEGQPQAVMSAYNRINGVHASQHRRLLTEILRKEWGFDGLVVSDWGAVDDPVASLAAGLDLEMPGNPLTPTRIVQAVQNGTLDPANLDRAVGNLLQLVRRQLSMEGSPKREVSRENHELARQVAVESIVLLDNDGTLPITSERPLRIGVVGNLAFRPRIQGIGSSQIQPTKLDIPWRFLEELGGRQGHSLRAWEVAYAEDGLTEQELGDLQRFLGELDLVLVFAGQKASYDAEAWDRPSMSLADADLALIEAAKAAHKPFVVVLIGGGAVDVTPFAADANALLMGWLGGQAFGSAIGRVIYGEQSPSGRLAETFAWSANDHASALNFPGGPKAVRYGEGSFVGYRYFQSFDREVAYPFGHGLSYTSFEYSQATAPATLANIESGFDLSLQVKNTGERAGAETVQVYLRRPGSVPGRPDRELIGFQKRTLDPGEALPYTIHVDPERLATWDETHDRWVTAPGPYELLVGASARDIRSVLPLEITTGDMPRDLYTLQHAIGDLYQDPRGRAVVDLMLARQGQGPLSQAAPDDFFAAIIKNLPLKKLSNFSNGALTEAILQQLLMLVNSDMTPEAVTATINQMMIQ